MIRRFGRAAARGRALQERRQIAIESTDARERLIGRCDLCGRAHGWPDVRVSCTRCGELRCHGWCRCEGKTDG